MTSATFIISMLINITVAALIAISLRQSLLILGSSYHCSQSLIYGDVTICQVTLVYYLLGSV